MVDKKINKKISDDLGAKALVVGGILDKIVEQLKDVEFNTTAFTIGDLMTYFESFGKLQVNLLESRRKLLLIPDEDTEQDKKIQAITNRLISMSESDLQRLELFINNAS